MTSVARAGFGSLIGLVALQMTGGMSGAAAPTSHPWEKWGDAGWTGAQMGVRNWQQQAKFVDVKINGPTAAGGRVAGPSLAPSIKSAMERDGAPAETAKAFAEAVAEAWKLWHEGVRLGSVPWYPSFASVPAAQAPPTPNVPTPLAALPSTQVASLSVPQLKQRIVARLGPLAQQPGAAAAIDKFAARFSNRFVAWLPTVMIKGVVGRGPVPGYKPPFSPVAAVVGGSVIEAPGAFTTPPF